MLVSINRRVSVSVLTYPHESVGKEITAKQCLYTGQLELFDKRRQKESHWIATVSLEQQL